MIKKLCLLFVLLNLFYDGFACTGIFLKTTDGNYIYARTLEFDLGIESEVLFIPRNYVLKSSQSGNKDTFSWKTTYAAIGANGMHIENFVDGINEKGLAGGLFYFPGFAKYESVSEEDLSRAIPMWILLTYILTQCASTDEVKELLKTIKISNELMPNWPSKFPPSLHIIVHDIKGNSLVIEVSDGVVKTFDSQLGIMTNSPNYDWHMTNLSNYINLDNEDVASKKLGNFDVKAVSLGTGMLGLPGDFTSPSRFVRATLMTVNSVPKDTENSIDQVFHILNNFDIPEGFVVGKQLDRRLIEYTQWTSAADLINKKFYFKMHENPQIYVVDLLKMNLNDSKPSIFPMKYPNKIIDVTALNSK